MHIAIVGPGALGCLLTSMLGRTDRVRLTLVDHNCERAGKLIEQGILYQFKEEHARIIVPVSCSPAEIGRADVVFLCVKSYDIGNCLRYCSPMLGEDTLLIFMQNGVSHLDVAGETGSATAAYGTTTEGANVLGPGQVRHAGRGLTQLGFLASAPACATRRLALVAELFNEAGLNTTVRDDILARLWTKLMVNTGINGLTATLDCPNGHLLTLPGASERMALLVTEAMAVAAALDIEVPADSLEITRDVCARTRHNISSMLQDVRGKRRTEIDAINGAVIHAARRLGLATPENDRLTAQVKALEQSYLK